MKILVDIRRAMLDLAIICPILLCSATVLMETWEGKRFVLFYLTPIFGMLFLWTYYRMRDIEAYRFFAMTLDICVLILAGLRIFGILPFSGHVLFFTYSGTTTDKLMYRTLAGIFLIETTVFKLWLWSDWNSWSLGLLAATVAIVAYFVIAKSKCKYNFKIVTALRFSTGG